MPGSVLPGNVSVYVTAADTHALVADAFVAIVNVDDTSVVYATGHTFPNGSCNFSGVSLAGGQSTYRVLAMKDGYYNG